MPGVPADPQNSATTDQPNAASTPIDTSVSMVEVPWRRLVQAARWKGQAPHTTTGAASVSDAHCQYSNWNAGTIASSTTGTVSTAESSSRCRSASSSTSASSRGAPASGPRSGSVAR